jgi:Peptidase C39 family
MNALVKKPLLKKAFRPDQLLHFGSGSKLPMIMQTEVAECGLASLAMIAGYYGFDTDMMNLRSRYSISSKGANLKHIITSVRLKTQTNSIGYRFG